jgi:hypothetical protein
MIENIAEKKKTRKKATNSIKKKKEASFMRRNSGDNSFFALNQIKEEINRTWFNCQSTESRIEKYADHISRLTDAIMTGELECFTIQRAAHILGISREYLFELAASPNHDNSKLLRKALDNLKSAIADSLMMGGIKGQYSSSLCRHYIPMYDNHAMDHEKAMALLKQLETPNTPINVILNKPSVTGKHQQNCGDTEPDGGF